MFADQENDKGITKEKRLNLLIKILNSNGRVNASSFMMEMRNRFGDGSYTLSNRTFYRDIELLKKKYNGAIQYDKRDKKFYLTEVLEPNEIQIEKRELKNFLLSARLMQGILPDALMQEWGKGLQSIVQLHRVRLAEEMNVLSLMTIFTNRIPVNSAILQVVFKAWEQRKTLKLELPAQAGKNLSGKVVAEPQLLVLQDGNWYIKGRVFPESSALSAGANAAVEIIPLHQISSAKLTDESFIDQPNLGENVEKQGFLEDPTLTVARIRFANDVVRDAEKRYHYLAKTAWEKGPNGSRILHLTQTCEEEVIRLVLQYRGKATVLEPESLRNTLAEMGETLRKNHQPEN